MFPLFLYGFAHISHTISLKQNKTEKWKRWDGKNANRMPLDLRWSTLNRCNHLYSHFAYTVFFFSVQQQKQSDGKHFCVNQNLINSIRCKACNVDFNLIDVHNSVYGCEFCAWWFFLSLLFRFVCLCLCCVVAMVMMVLCIIIFDISLLICLQLTIYRKCFGKKKHKSHLTRSISFRSFPNGTFSFVSTHVSFAGDFVIGLMMTRMMLKTKVQLAGRSSHQSVFCWQ